MLRFNLSLLFLLEWALASGTVGRFFPIAEGNKWEYHFEDYSFENASLPWMRSSTTLSFVTVTMSDVHTSGDTTFFNLENLSRTLSFNRLDVTGERVNYPEREARQARYGMFELSGGLYVREGGGDWTQINKSEPFASLFLEKFRFLISPELPRALGEAGGPPTDRFEKTLLDGDSLYVYESRREWESGSAGEFILDYSRFAQGLGLIESYYREGYGTRPSGGGDRRYSFQLFAFNDRVYNDSLYRQSRINLPKKFQKHPETLGSMGVREFNEKFLSEDFEILNVMGEEARSIVNGVYLVRSREAGKVHRVLVREGE